MEALLIIGILWIIIPPFVVVFFMDEMDADSPIEALFNIPIAAYRYGKENLNIIGTIILVALATIALLPGIIIAGILIVGTIYLVYGICKLFYFIFKKRDKHD